MIYLLNAPVYLVGVLIAAIVSIVIGMLWYSPKVFGKKWLEIRGKKMEDLKSSPTDMVYATLGALAMSLVLAIFIGYVIMGSAFTLFVDGYLNSAQENVVGPAMILGGAWSPIVIGIVVAFLAWLGFVIPSALNGVIWEEGNKKLFVFNMTYLLVNLIVMSVVYIIVSGGMDMNSFAGLG